jgi:diguanylate cyclase (GGDEF)-like protein
MGTRTFSGSGFDGGFGGNGPEASPADGLREAPRHPWTGAGGSAVVPLDSHRRPPAEAPRPELELPPRSKPLLRVLVVDDAQDDFLLVRDLLTRAPDTRFRVEWASTFDAGLRRLAAETYDGCLVDFELGGRDGLEFLRLAQHRGFETPIVLTAGQAEHRVDLEAMELGAADFVDKEEFDVERLERTLRFAVARRRAAERLGRLAQYDDLTGLANRALLTDRLERALAAARRQRGIVAVMLLDLNGFKPVNDLLGHGAGDRLLRIVADRLSGRVRETDTVARLGGDEFALVIEGLGRPEQAALVARKLLDTIAPPIRLDAEDVAVTASLGVALYPRDGDDPAALLRLADAAMYRAKGQGGNHCCFHDPGVDSRMRRGVILEQDLRRALERDEFMLQFQPQVTLRQGELGLASLIRWQHPELGIVDAERFRSLAEDTGLLEPLTDWLLDAACRHIGRWHAMGLQPMHVAVPILSRRQLGWSQLPRRVRDQLAHAGLPAGSLELEIGERLLLDEVESGGQALPTLAELGVRLAVEGFGSGPTSLVLLRDAGLRTLKLSRALLAGTPEDEHRSLFAAAVIRLAKQLGLRVVAEGAEGRSQLHMLRREGCDAVQAFMSCPPLPADACTDWLRSAAQRG